MRCLIVFNPYSGNGKFIKKIDIVKLKLNKIYQEIDVFCSNKIGSITNKIINDGDKCDLIFIAGGDGTLSEVINALMKIKSKPNIYYYPCGTFNDFASSFHLKVKLDKAIDIIKKGQTKKFDLIQINDKFFIYASAFGKFTDASYNVNNTIKKHFKGLAYYLKIIKSLFKKYDLKYTCYLDNVRYEINNYISFFIHSLKIGGFKMHFKEKPSFDEQYFYYVAIKKSPFQFLNFLLFFFFGEHYKSKNIIFKRVNKIEITSFKEIKLNGDGELLLKSNELRISTNEDNYINLYVNEK